MIAFIATLPVRQQSLNSFPRSLPTVAFKYRLGNNKLRRKTRGILGECLPKAALFSRIAASAGFLLLLEFPWQ
jgi:hypothetical protein